MYEVVNAVPLNELSKETFVYKVLDEMMSRQMYGLAEQVVSCVGIGEAPVEEEEDDDDDDDDDEEDEEEEEEEDDDDEEEDDDEDGEEDDDEGDDEDD